MIVCASKMCPGRISLRLRVVYRIEFASEFVENFKSATLPLVMLHHNILVDRGKSHLQTASGIIATKTLSYIPVYTQPHFPSYNPLCRSNTCALYDQRTWNRIRLMIYAFYTLRTSPRQAISYACGG